VPIAQAGVASVMVGDTAAAIPLVERSVNMFQQAGVAGFITPLKGRGACSQ